MEVLYESTQPAYVIIGVSVLVCGVIFLITKKFLIPTVILSCLLIVFHSLTIRMSTETIEWYFGFGLWKYSESLDDIERIRVVQTSWKNGFGIRKLNDVRLYNVSTGDALEFTLKDGRIFAIESSDPLQLKKTIDGITNT